jgi:hypothetical protein
MLGKGNELLASIDLAAAQLTATANRIQRQVAEEVTKTQPNLAALFQGGGALRANAHRFSGSGLLAPAAAGTAKGEAKALRPSAQASTELDRLRAATQELLDSADRLQIWLNRADSLARQVGSLSACTFNSAAGHAALAITPNVHEVTMRKGSSMVWEVSGVSGAPRATLVGDSPGTLASQADVAVSAREGMQLVTLTLKGDIGEGQDLRLLISDATGGARRGNQHPATHCRVTEREVRPCRQRQDTDVGGGNPATVCAARRRRQDRGMRQTVAGCRTCSRSASRTGWAARVSPG